LTGKSVRLVFGHLERELRAPESARLGVSSDGDRATSTE
jgi:hypothetical protein